MTQVNGKWAKDRVDRQVQAVTSIPSGSGVIVATSTIAAGSTFTWFVNIIPSNTALSLWNLAYDLLIDNGSSYSFSWPWGSSMTSQIQKGIRVESWMSVGKSVDTANKRTFIVHIENNDTVSHTTYLLWKAYTVSASTGVAS